MGHTQNIGLGGLLLWLPELLEVDTVLRLCLGLAEGPVTADGTVIWHDPQVTSEGKVPHGIRILRFWEDADLERYRRFLDELPVEAGH